MSETSLFSPDWAAPANVKAVFSTRNAGTSTGVYRSLNLGDHVGDDRNVVHRNRELVRTQLPAEPRWLKQEHTDICIHANDYAEGVIADGAVTDNPGEVLAVMVADCLPILLARNDGSMVAVAHAGWRGLAAGIIERTVTRMGSTDLTCWFGPCIQACHYEVGEEVKAAFGATGFSARGSKWMMDLPAVAREQLERLGVTDISDCGECTFSEEKKYFSHRRDGTCGRMAGFIWLES